MRHTLTSMAQALLVDDEPLYEVSLPARTRDPPLLAERLKRTHRLAS